MTVTIKKINGSIAVLIPSALAREMKLTEGTSLEISGSASSIVMRRKDRASKRSLRSITAKMKASSYRSRSRDWSADATVGREIW
jgi:antitoxin component of MazEF toxin-antitoxin module